MVGRCRGWIRIVVIAYVGCTAAHAANERSGIVLPGEMDDARTWLDGRLAAPPAITVRGISQGWGMFHHGWSVNHLPLTLKGKTYDSGFGSHADAVVEIVIPDGEAQLTATCGIDDTPEARTAAHTAIFLVEADGKEVFKSNPVAASDTPLDLKIDVRGVKKIILKANATADQSYLPIDWVDVRVTSAKGDVQVLGHPETFAHGTGELFSFMEDGRPSETFISSWKFKSESLPDGSDTTGQRFTWTDPASGLQTIVEMKRYTHYPVVEWVQRFKNTGQSPTPVLEKIRSMDLTFPCDDKLLLHYNTGDYAVANSYQPFVTPLVAETSMHFAPVGGRPTDHAWPYYNIEQPEQQRGAIIVVGWPGQWSSDISRSSDDGELRIRAGQELTHLRLLPGEEIRTPLSVMMFYRGDATRAQNLWRRWMLDCNVPRPNGQLPPAIHASSLGLFQSEKSESDGITLFSKENAGLTHWWMDAGWYPCKEGDGGWWFGAGSWDPDPVRFPHGIRPVSDLAHADGIKTILWFEPERAHEGTWLWEHHPEWLLIYPAQKSERLLDLGNPDAWKWLTDKVDQALTSQGIDLYRQDFNFEPLAYWRTRDADDRQGMTENKHVVGYLAFWDELHRRHPNMLIDTCASGGRRLDLETLRRSVSLWPSDDSLIPEDNQSHAFGVASWMVYFGSGVANDSSYLVRSGMFPFWAYGVPTDNRKMDWDQYRRESANWSSIRESMIGDYYPLTPYSLDPSTWLAWQYDRPDLSSGVIQAFRRPKSPFTSARFPLHGIDGKAEYLVKNFDLPEANKVISGQELIDVGVDVTLNDLPAAAIVTYAKVK